MQVKSNKRNASQRSFGIGIDFGTSKSAVAVARGLSTDEVEILQVRKKDDISHPGSDSAEIKFFPAYVRVEMRDRVRLLFDLLDRPGPHPIPSDPDSFITTNFKLLVGKAWTPKEQNALEEALLDFQAPLPEPQELAGCMIYRLRAGIRTNCEDENVPIYRCVLSIPPGWTYQQRRATVYAARMAGFREIALVEEPVASLIGLRNNKSRSSARGLHLVVDFGAGTCDVALMEKSEGNHHFVIDSDSDNNLGGRKIDEELLKWVISRSPYELDDERPIILGEGVKPDTRIYYHALWQVEKWKISQNEYFKGRIAKPERLNLSLAGLQKLSKNITSISREDFEQIVESHIADRLNSLFVHVLNNQKERLQNVKSIVLTGGSSRLIGFRSLVTEFVAEISGLDMDSVEDLIVEAQDPRWTVVRGTAIVDYGLTVGNRIVTSPLPHNIELEVKNGETNEELKLLQGTLRIRGRSASVDRRLPFQKCFRMRVIEDAHCVCINIYLDTRSEDSLVDRLTMTPIHGHKIIPKGTLIEVHYRITEGGTFHVERFLVGSKIESRIKHDVFHHTDEDGKPSCEVIESRRKFSLVPEMEKIPQNKEEVKSFFESLPFYTQDFLESINWKKRLRDFAWGFVLVFLFFGNVFVALGFGLIISATMPEHIDLVEIVLERLKEILGRLQ